MRKFLVTGLIAASATVASADVYGPGAGGAIPDATPAGLSTTINAVNVANPTIVSVNSVTVSFSTAHTWVGDLVITLTAPNGDNVDVIHRTGAAAGGAGDSSNAAGPYTFDAAGADFTAAAAALPTGSNVPAGTYARFTNAIVGTPASDPDNYSVFNGDNLNGNWTLNVSDWAGADLGTLGSWSMDITSVPEPTSLALLALGGLVALRRR